MRVLEEVYRSRALSLVCEVALMDRKNVEGEKEKRETKIFAAKFV